MSYKDNTQDIACFVVVQLCGLMGDICSSLPDMYDGVTGYGDE